jgi:hypothetical protein
MKFLIFLTIPLIALLASCSSTPQSRIKNNPELFLSLTPKHQALVKEGKIDRGMPEKAVYLAMGNPDSKITGNRDGRSYMRWDYSVLMPVYTSTFGGYYGYGGYHHGCGSGFYGGYYPSVAYIPTRGSSIYFKKGIVTGWERVRH